MYLLYLLVFFFCFHFHFHFHFPHLRFFRFKLQKSQRTVSSSQNLSLSNLIGQLLKKRKKFTKISNQNSKTSEINFFTFLFKMEKLSLFVVSLALLILGLWEVVTWPNWALSESALLLLLGSVCNQIYALAELSSATAFAIFGLFGVYFSAVGGSSLSHKLTGRFEVLMILPLLVLYTSAVAFMIIGSELMAHNAPLTAIIGRLWSWRYNQDSNRLRILAKIEGTYSCCGWSQTRAFAVSDFCHRQNPTQSFPSCSVYLLNYSGKLIYRQGLMVVVYTVPLLLLLALVIYSHKSDPVAADVEEAETLNDRRKQLYSGNAPAIQLQ